MERDIKMYKYLDIPGWFNMHDAYMNIVKYVDDGQTIVEIGCFAGRSTRFLLDGLDYAGKHKVKVHVIDTFEGSGMEHAKVNLSPMYDEFMRNLDDYIQDERIIVHVNRSDNQNILDSFATNSVAAVIIDGDHTMEAVEKDVYNWWPKVMEGGIMVGDDVRLDSVKQGCYKGLAKHGIDSVTHVRGEEGWFAKIKHPNADKLGEQLKLIPGVNSMKLDG
jgi:predicted O-methyltransferase YrrM